MLSIAPLPATKSLLPKLRNLLRALLSLIKIRIVLLVAIVTTLGYWLAAGSFRPLSTLFFALLGTSLASAGAGVLNNVLERDVDARMVRTRERALPTGLVSPVVATWFGIVLTIGGSGLLVVNTGPLPALLSTLAAGLYLFVYTPLKRLTWLNTPLGAIPGAIPPLIGWASATGGSLEIGGWILFAMLFLWQHPHFYAIAWVCREDYDRAGLRMAGMAGNGELLLTRQVIGSLITLIPVSFLLTVIGTTGVWFSVGIIGAGGLYLLAGIRFARKLDLRSSRLLLRASVLYLPAVLLLLLTDRILTAL